MNTPEIPGRAGPAERSILGWAALAGGILVAFILIALAARGAAPIPDEWGYAHRLATQPLNQALFDSPENKYLLTVPLLIYDGVLQLFGLSSYVPLRVTGLLFLALAAALVFVLARRRVGDLAALPVALLPMFLGAASAVVVVPSRLPSQVAVVLGLGALVAMERVSVRRDAAACVLLLGAVCSHPVGVPFVVAGAVRLLLRPAPERWRRLWVVAVPAVAFGLWYLLGREVGENPFGAPSPGDVISFAARYLEATVAAVTGFFREPWTSGIDFFNPIAAVLTVAFVLAIAIRIRRPSRVPASLWAVLAALVAMLIEPTLSPGGVFRSPEEPRYLYPAAVVLLLALAEMGGGVVPQWERRTRVAAGIATAVVVVISLSANVSLIERRGDSYAEDGAIMRARLGALELARKHLGGTNASGAGLFPPLTFGVDVGELYYPVRDEFGTPANTPQQLAGAPAGSQHAADDVLVSAYEPIVHRTVAPPGDGAPPRADRELAGTVARQGPCLALLPQAIRDQAAPLAVIELPAGGAWLQTPASAELELRLGRFGEPNLPLRVPAGARRLAVEIPRDRSSVPWRMTVLARDPVRACALD